MRKKFSEAGSATAELVVALPFLIALALIGVRFVGATLEEERLRFLAESVVQAIMRDESNEAIKRQLNKALPGASFTISEGAAGAEGEFVVTLRRASASATAQGFR